MRWRRASRLSAGCGDRPKATKTAGSGTEGEDTGSMAGATERETISKAGADQIIPKEKKRNITADQRADFDKAMKRYADARKDGAVSGGECSGVSDAFKRVADDNPGLIEARFNQGAVLYECGREDEAARIWTGLKYGPAITNLGYIAWKNNETGRAESLFKRARSRTIRCTASRRASTSLRSCATRLASIERPPAPTSYVKDKPSPTCAQVLALDGNSLQAYATLCFIYFDLKLPDAAILIGTQALKRADEIATGKFEDERVDQAENGKNRVPRGQAKKGKKGKKE